MPALPAPPATPVTVSLPATFGSVTPEINRIPGSSHMIDVDRKTGALDPRPHSSRARSQAKNEKTRRKLSEPRISPRSTSSLGYETATNPLHGAKSCFKQGPFSAKAPSGAFQSFRPSELGQRTARVAALPAPAPTTFKRLAVTLRRGRIAPCRPGNFAPVALKAHRGDLLPPHVVEWPRGTGGRSTTYRPIDPNFSPACPHSRIKAAAPDAMSAQVTRRLWRGSRLPDSSAAAPVSPGLPGGSSSSDAELTPAPSRTLFTPDKLAPVQQVHFLFCEAN
ncbi:hypothetical protein SKAU_G00188320 [Synaphobranchus kaupii]|uniref:Uncharacterized protein n=1 Tax=Synaphobranchus kaupii TaxID=118154 RepID=A0A9Q1FDI7_SYNKA|nr:hypothetical protein SKAU_G00188320 [Synaphobranchus kaupii]